MRVCCQVLAAEQLAEIAGHRAGCDEKAFACSSLELQACSSKTVHRRVPLQSPASIQPVTQRFDETAKSRAVKYCAPMSISPNSVSCCSSVQPLPCGFYRNRVTAWPSAVRALAAPSRPLPAPMMAIARALRPISVCPDLVSLIASLILLNLYINESPYNMSRVW